MKRPFSGESWRGAAIAVAFLLSVASITRRAAAAERPNILLILADDIGYSDIGCYGGEIRTPRLDALADSGLRFSQSYNTARCCPTRASLLTGLYPHQAGVGHMMSDMGHEGYRGNLNDRCLTIAEALRPAGYRSFLCGKWHVTRFAGPQDDRSQWPLQRGFDRFYGTITGAGSFYDPATLCRQNTFITPENDPEYRPETYYYTDAISDNAVRFLGEHHEASPEQPFFLYLAYTAAHWPMHALPEDIARYRGIYDEGYGPARQRRLERLRQLGLVRPEWRLTEQAGDWNAVADRAWESRCMEVYAAMVECMDRGIGRILDVLRDQGRLEDTLVLYLQDNGGCAEGIGRGKAQGDPPAGLRPFGPDELQPQIWPPMQTRDGRWVRTGPGVMPGPADTYIAYGRNWANVSNTPFREYKHWVHEGGIATPLIAHWPAGIPGGRRGSLVHDPVHLIDVMATCLDVSGAGYPAERDGQALTPPEGISLRPALGGDSLRRPGPLFWEHEGNRAVREGRWKLVAKEDAPWELYDMDADRTETRNLAGDEPGRVESLAAAWDQWAARAGVLPLGAWRTPAEGNR